MGIEILLELYCHSRVARTKVWKHDKETITTDSTECSVASNGKDTTQTKQTAIIVVLMMLYEHERRGNTKLLLYSVLCMLIAHIPVDMKLRPRLLSSFRLSVLIIICVYHFR